MCNTTITKYLLFTFNLVFWLIGLFLIGVGVWAKADPLFVERVLSIADEATDDKPVINENDLVYVHYMAYFLIGLGAVINIIALFGCCGAIKESRCCLGLFFTTLLICFLVTIVFGGFLLFVAATAKSNDEPTSQIREAFLAACDMAWQVLSDGARANFEKAHECSGNSDGANSCKAQLIDTVQDQFFICGGVIMGVALVEVIGMAMSCVLFNRFTHVYTAV